MKQYQYLGSSDFLATLPKESGRLCVHSANDVIIWLKETKQPHELDGAVVLTFIISVDGKLWINERRSEHVLCAAKQNVLSAGEMSFIIEADTLVISAVTNQSTGYCPEPESWPAVANALDKLGIKHPQAFTMACIFRRCESCESINIVKDEWFYCAVCDAELPQAWNFTKEKK